MLKTLIIGALAALIVAIASASVNNAPRPQIIHYQIDTENMPNSYNFFYDNSDGSSRTERGVILNPNSEQAALDVGGNVRWYDETGQLYEMTYKAGKRGYRTSIKKVKS